jgi:hypothetical protein
MHEASVDGRTLKMPGRRVPSILVPLAASIFIAGAPFSALAASSLSVAKGWADPPVVIYRGAARETYSCMPVCMPRITLGDDPGYFGKTLDESIMRNSVATTGAHAESEMRAIPDARVFRAPRARATNGGPPPPGFPSETPSRSNQQLGPNTRGFLGPYTPNAYGPGVNSDATGRPFVWQPSPGFGPADPFSNVTPNVYGPGIGMDQFGRPVTPACPPGQPFC